ncbi:MAG TPA: TetR/AcrR family transcriptional regulator [Terriglobia bacterium]|nr:TetR/AcrR family transcriptional regulator [Terriglobia bacterium]
MTIMKNKRERGRPRAFDRDAVLERAMRIFWAAGYECASMPMLTEAMGISAQSLYAAFGSKEALYREAIELYRKTAGGFSVHALEAADALDAVTRLLREAAITFSRADTPGCMITMAPAGLEDEPLTLLGRELRADGVLKVAERLRRGIDQGQIQPGTDCTAWARYVVGVVQGLSVQARDGAPIQDLLSTATIASEALRSIRTPDTGEDK